MKALRLAGLALLGILFAWAPARSFAAASVGFSFFYDELSPYGQWIDSADYGYVWQPSGVGAGWGPYTHGQWIYTDDGWFWDSDEDWGWATYHYGRWVNLSGYGWAWVPGTQWAPAWVSWRTSPSYVGWAPLPPEAVWRPNTGIRFGVSFDIGPSSYNFCPNRYFGYNNVGRYCAPRHDNVNIIQNTTNVTNITNIVNNNNTVIYNGGPNYDALRRQASIRRANIDRVTAVQPGKRPRNTLRGNQLRVAAPHVQRRPGAKPRHVAARVPKGRTDRGWSAIKDRRQAQALRQRMRNETRQAGVRKPANTAAARHRQAQAAARTAPGHTRNPHAAVNSHPAATHRKRQEAANAQAVQRRRANATKAEANRPRPSRAPARSQRASQQRPPVHAQSHARPRAQIHPSRQRPQPQPRHEAARNRHQAAPQPHRQAQVRQPSRPPQAQHQRQRPPAHRPQPQAQRARQNPAHAAAQHPQGGGKKKKKNE
jgi:hypothetical protein